MPLLCRPLPMQLRTDLHMHQIQSNTFTIIQAITDEANESTKNTNRKEKKNTHKQFLFVYFDRANIH